MLLLKCELFDPSQQLVQILFFSYLLSSVSLQTFCHVSAAANYGWVKAWVLTELKNTTPPPPPSARSLRHPHLSTFT